MASGNGEKVLVTGASGYIASHIVQQLLEAGYKVRGTVRSLSNASKVEPLRKLCPNASSDLELIEADLTKDEGWKEAVAGCVYVMHTASPFPFANPKDENKIIKPAVEGTTRVLQACVDQGGVKRVVLTSSVVAVTDFEESRSPDNPFTEEDWRKERGDAYGKSKLLAERAAWDFVNKLSGESKFELAVINPSVVFGPVVCGSPGTSVNILKGILTREPGIIPRMHVPFCDVRDVAKAHVVAMTMPEAAGNRHIVAPYCMMMRDISQILVDEFSDKGYKPVTTVAPNFLLRLMGIFNSEVKTMSKLVGHTYAYSDKRLRQVLGITPYSAKDTVNDTAYSCIERGFVPKKEGYYNPKAK
ncbi:uncharacterized protein [Diadema setosum]|uniref:uncharacterized protein n=1 Tax=Diadema setosum TaxID=31175 RepID=UPI003B3BBE59